MLILENDNVLEVAGMIDAVADPKLALRVDRACCLMMTPGCPTPPFKGYCFNRIKKA